MKQYHLIEIDEAAALLSQSLSDWFLTRYGNPAEPSVLQEIIATSLANIADTQRKNEAEKQYKITLQNMRERVESKK